MRQIGTVADVTNYIILTIASMRKTLKFNLLVFTALVAMLSCCSCGKDKGGDEGKKSEENPLCLVRFDKSGEEEFFNVAVRDSYRKNIYFVFRVNHYKDHSPLEYKDLWRVDWAYEGKYDSQSGTMNNILDKILTDGESESVFKDYGENLNVQGKTHIDTYDFTGGYHGDERIDLYDDCGVTFFMDGKPLEQSMLSASFGWTPCDEFSYTQHSSMHKTALKVDGKAQISDHHIVAIHSKETVFSDSGYVTRNSLTMKDAIDFYWYFGICCVGRAVADKGCNEDMKTVSFDASGGNQLEAVGKKEYRAWYDANSIEVHVKAELTEGGDDSMAKMFIWDNPNYAKYYRRYPAQSAHRTSDGEKFSSVMSVKFSTR